MKSIHGATILNQEMEMTQFASEEDGQSVVSRIVDCAGIEEEGAAAAQCGFIDIHVHIITSVRHSRGRYCVTACVGGEARKGFHLEDSDGLLWGEGTGTTVHSPE